MGLASDFQCVNGLLFAKQIYLAPHSLPIWWIPVNDRIITRETTP